MERRNLRMNPLLGTDKGADSNGLQTGEYSDGTALSRKLKTNRSYQRDLVPPAQVQPRAKPQPVGNVPQRGAWLNYLTYFWFAFKN